MTVGFDQAFEQFIEWLKNFKLRPAIKRRVLYMLMKELSTIENYAKYRASWLALRGIYVEPTTKMTMTDDSVILVLRLRVLGVDEPLMDKLSRKLVLDGIIPSAEEIKKLAKAVEKGSVVGPYLNDDEELVGQTGSGNGRSGQDMHQGTGSNPKEDGGGGKQEGNNAGGAGSYGDNGGDRMKQAIKHAIVSAITKKARYDEEVGDFVIEDIGNIRYDDEMKAYIALARQLFNKPSKLPRR